MRKIISIITTVLFVLCFTGCGSKQATEKNSSDSPTDSPTEIETAPITEAPTEEQPQLSNKGTVNGQYDVEIVSARISNDYQGNPAAIVTYSFTNNGNSNATFLTSVSANAFQNSVQCGVAVITSGEMDAQPSMSQVQPGGTLEVECAYSLQDTTNPVTIQVGPYVNFSGEVNAQMTFTFD